MGPLNICSVIWLLHTKMNVFCFHGFMTSLQSKYTEEVAAKGRGFFCHLVMIHKQQACVY